MEVANVEIAGSVVGVISPVLSAIILALVTYMIRKYLPENVRGEVEKSVNEAESEIKKEIQNGITSRLDHIVSKVDPDTRTTPAENKVQSDISEAGEVVPVEVTPPGMIPEGEVK